MDRTLIDRYRADADLPLRGIAGLTDAELDARPIPNTWSIRQIVLHLMDADLIASDRIKRVLAEHLPLLCAFDENAFVTRLDYVRLDAAAAAEIFRLNRHLTASLLSQQPDAAFERVGIHTERGRVTAAELVADYVQHLDGHMQHLWRKRELLGKAPR